VAADYLFTAAGFAGMAAAVLSVPDFDSEITKNEPEFSVQWHGY